MHKAVLIGERSKIGKSILSHWSPLLTLIPSTDLDHEKIDFLFICTTKEKASAFIKPYAKSPNLVIFDFSGLSKSKVGVNPNYSYAFDPIFDKTKSVIAFPGCSSLGILNALYPLKDILTDQVFIDTRFPRSALKHDSPNLLKLDNNTINLLVGSHPHESEVKKILGYEYLTMNPSIIDILQGISLSIFLPKLNAHLVKQKLQSFYEHDLQVFISEYPLDVKSVVGSSKCGIYISGSEEFSIINVVIDNLINDRYVKFLNFNNPYFII